MHSSVPDEFKPVIFEAGKERVLLWLVEQVTCDKLYVKLFCAACFAAT